MTRRTITVEGKEYKYIVTKGGLKIDGIGFYEARDPYYDRYEQITPKYIRQQIENYLWDKKVGAK